MKSNSTTLTIKSWQVFLIATSILLALFVTVLCIGIMMRYEVDSDVSNVESVSYWKVNLPKEQSFWFQQGINELNLALNLNRRSKFAQNVVIFMVHGIGPEALTAARFVRPMHQSGRANLMSWDTFPHLGRLKNSCSDPDMCDPFTVTTALYGGVKTNFKIGSLDASVNFRNCTAAAKETHQILSIFQLAQQRGIRTGFVTTGRVTGSSVAALYAHTPDSSWECDAAMPKGTLTNGCKDIAYQLIEGETGQNFNVIMGGGRQTLVSNVPRSDSDEIDDSACNSVDGRNLLGSWQRSKLEKKEKFEVLQNVDDLQHLNGSYVNFVMGVFANGNLKSNKESKHTKPDLRLMVNKSLEVLKRRKTGYMLLVDSGVKQGSDMSTQISELLEVNDIIELILNSSDYSENTLVLAAFTNGEYVKTSIDTSVETDVVSNFKDIMDNDALLDKRFQNIITETMIYAKGPSSYLFHGIHEETYMAHVISYALQIGQFGKLKNNSIK